MQKTGSLAVLFSLIAAVFFSPACQADNEKKDPVLIYRDAGANNEQEAKIRQLASDYEKLGRVKMERMHNLAKQLTQLSYDADLDEEKLLTVQQDINELQSDLNNERIKLMVKIRNLLTAEQKSKLLELMKERDLKAPPSPSPDP